ncbi:MAG: heavy metal translocating P-type ATPase metal-binding domain-containing protein [Halioglobus sp.]|nr:heavy metal translocating P-type ATPase metal-binding domain-containing protein [Halioglobus sp.]
MPPDCDLSIEIDGQRRPMCCPGCRAVAALVSSSGLSGFYLRRTAFNDRPASGTNVAQNSEFRVYDEPDVASTFTATDPDGITTATILIGGVNCAACTWLIEQSLLKLNGVKEAVVNLQHSRLNIRFDTDRLQLSEIFTRLAELGYRPRPYEHAARREQLQAERRDDLRRLSVAGLGMMQVGMFAIALHAGDIQGMDDNYRALLRWVSLPVAGLVVIYSARPFFATAWRHLRAGALVMDTPVALAIGLAFAASAWATVSGGGQVYFDSVVMFTFFLLLGRFLEKRARQRNTDAWLNAGEDLPASVTVMRDGAWATQPRLRLRAGDEVLIRGGETVPIDAVVVAGHSMVREDFFSGEHLPRQVASGATIYAGTLNLEENLRARALGSCADTRLAAMREAVEFGTGAKPRLVRVADRIAGRFVAAILLLACVTMLAWLQIAPDRALWVTLSVLVISCPCALALATPAALASAATALRRRGVLVRGENALEALPACTHLLFDKTGTLTLGRLRVARVHLLGNTDEAHVLAIGAALQVHANHPLADAFIPLSHHAAI